MKRIYFLSPDLSTTHRIVDDLLLARVEERHIHVLAKRETPLEDLPEASLMQKSDFVPAIQRGLTLGGAVGFLAGLVAIALPGSNLVIAGGIVLSSSLAGAGVGAWLSGMAGINLGNTRLQRFEKAIADGELLVMVDAPGGRVEEIEARIKEHLPNVALEGTEPTIPAFP